MTEEESDDFAEAMRDVAPLNQANKVVRSSPGAAPSETLEVRREAAQNFAAPSIDPNYLTLGDVKSKDPLEFLEWRQDGIQLAVCSKLRRGGYAIEAELDLHHKTVKEARAEVFRLIDRAYHRQWRCVLISHGKGLHSQTPGRLKSYVAHWLIQHRLVLAYCSAERHRGGVGSAYVLIKKSPESKEQNRERFGLSSDPG
mgnify:FL=1|tara:strand:- start:31 stop:627 length:597 start_codon:yes stop_codon:yes gene_type:complete